MKNLNFPLFITWNITSNCNLRCKHCLNNSGTRLPNQLTDEEIFNLIIEFSKAGMQEIRFTGGEPLVHRRVYDFIANSEEPVTADDIVADIGEESFTKAKAVARCTALVKEGRITKEEIKVNKVRKMTYQVAETEEEEV